MKKRILLIVILFCTAFAQAQEVFVTADFVSSYIWRGVYEAGPSLQPGLTLGIGNFTIAAWGSVDFTSSSYKEADLMLSYRLKNITFHLKDLYDEGSASDDVAPVAVAEPKRRRVRRKVASAGALGDTAPEPVELDVTPAEAAIEVAETVEAEEPEVVEAPVPVVPEPAAPKPVAEAEPVVEAEPEPARLVDVQALIAEDPAQITTPAEKPKRGWWRR